MKGCFTMEMSIDDGNPRLGVKRDYSFRNAAISGGIGFIGGGIPAYIRKQIVKRHGGFTDEFIREVSYQVAGTPEEDKFGRQLIKNMIELPDDASLEQIKAAGAKSKKFAGSSDEKVLRDFKELKIGIAAIKRLLAEEFDTGKKQFSDELRNSDGWKYVRNAILKIKGRTGLVCGATTGLVLGACSFVASKIASK